MMSVFFHFQHALNLFFNNCKGGWGSILEKSQKKLVSKSPALLGLNFMCFTDLFYKEISFHFFMKDFFTQPVTKKRF